MLLMVLVRKWGHRKASKQKADLEKIAEDKRTRGDERLNEVRKLIDSIFQHLPPQPPRNPDNNAR